MCCIDIDIGIDKMKRAERTEAVNCDFTNCGFCPPVLESDSDDILLESVVNRRCRLPRPSLAEGWKGEKNRFCPRGGDTYPE